jgi:ethanolamine ammonia-lyase small subunit
MLDPASKKLLAARSGGSCRLTIVIGDGLSASAVNVHAVEVVRSLIPRLAIEGMQFDHAVVATGARVALGDEIGEILEARMIVMLIGERPGVSAPDSLGAYLTFAPKLGRSDAERNCVSNIHGAGLGYDEAASRIAWLIREALARKMTGIALKDESGDQAPRRITPNSSRKSGA